MKTTTYEFITNASVVTVSVDGVLVGNFPGVYEPTHNPDFFGVSCNGKFLGYYRKYRSQVVTKRSK